LPALNPNLSERIAILLGDRSIRSFAADVGVPEATVRHYLRGRMPPADFIAALCVQTGASSWWLLTGEGPMHAAPPATPAAQADPDLARAQAALARIRAAGDERCWTVVTATIAAADSQGGAHADGKSEGLAHTA
jgi:hypothetical protein